VEKEEQEDEHLNKNSVKVHRRVDHRAGYLKI